MELEDDQSYSANESQFNMNCTDFTVEDMKFFNRLRNITALICAAITLAILLFLICQKAYSSLFQRLYLYLVIGTLLAETAVGLNIEHQWHYSRQETVCVWLGFFTQWTCVLVLILSYEIVVHLLCLVGTKMKGSSSPPRCRFIRSKCYSMILEIVAIHCPTRLNFNQFCCVSVRKEELRCGWTLVLGTFAKQSVWAFRFCDTNGILWPLCISRCSSNGCKPRVCRYLLQVVQRSPSPPQETLYVMIFQFIHILVILCNLSLRLYTLISQRDQLYGLWSAHAFTIPIGILVFPLGYLLCFYPVIKVTLALFQRINRIILCFKPRMSSRQMDVPTFTKLTTAPRSDRISQPSDTFFIVPHPDELTEASPLISDTGYGSSATLQYSQHIKWL